MEQIIEQTAKQSRRLAKKARRLLKIQHKKYFVENIPQIWIKINEAANKGYKEVNLRCFNLSYKHEEFVKEYFDRFGYIISIEYEYLKISWEKPNPEPEILSLSQKIRKMWENITKDL